VFAVVPTEGTGTIPTERINELCRSREQAAADSDGGGTSILSRFALLGSGGAARNAVYDSKHVDKYDFESYQSSGSNDHETTPLVS
jgi:hypothetical protein